MSVRYALATDRGSVRENNEDCVRAVPERGLFVVADGMGGHAGGEIASHVAVETFVQELMRKDVPRRIRDEHALMHRAVQAANDAVLDAAREHRLPGMGTTLTAAVLRGRTATIAHIGDSRAYLAGKELRPLTGDHTVVALLVQSGVITASEAHVHPDRHVLTHALGTQSRVECEVLQRRIPKGSRLLLCSDGLHDVVPADDILAIALQDDLERAAQRMVESAKACGGPDNITLILIEP